MRCDGHGHGRNTAVQRVIILVVLALFTILHFVSVERIYLIAVTEMSSVVVKMLGML